MAKKKYHSHGYCNKKAKKLTNALTDPDSEHVELEQAPVDRLAVIEVHEDVIEEGSDPRAHGADQVAPGEKARERAPRAPWKQVRHRHQYINNGKS